LCLGDSLTAGYCDNGFDEKPYARALGEELGPSIDVKAIGYSGLTTGEILDILEVSTLVDLFLSGLRGAGSE